jgi:hypothetical protein
MVTIVEIVSVIRVSSIKSDSKINLGRNFMVNVNERKMTCGVRTLACELKRLMQFFWNPSI